MSRQRLMSLGGGATGILLLLLLVLGVTTRQTTTAQPPTPPTPPEGCATQVHFFSTDMENNFFGPAAEGGVEELKGELRNRRCVDPALTVAHAHVEGLPGFAELNGDDQFAGKIRELIANPELWRATVGQVEEKETGATATVETMSGSYETLYMLDGVTDVPLIRKDQPDRPDFAVLRFAYPDGATVNYKLDCGFQPVGQFPGVPHVSVPLPGGQPPPGPPLVPPGTTPPTTEKPELSFDCQQNGVGCPPGVNPAWVQPVQDNTTSGVNTGPTPGAPAEEPPPAVRPPGDPNGSSGPGDAGPPTGPVDDSSRNDVTPTTFTPPCPFGPGNC